MAANQEKIRIPEALFLLKYIGSDQGHRQQGEPVMFADLVKSQVLLILRIYQYAISPLLGRNCRFYPSCSAYAREAVEVHGLSAGSFLSIKRLFRCHPWHPGGNDPVPGCLDEGHDVVDVVLDELDEPRTLLPACNAKAASFTNSSGFCDSKDSPVNRTTTTINVQNQTGSMAR